MGENGTIGPEDKGFAAMVLHEGEAGPRLIRLPLRAPGPGEVLVRLGAAGLNFADLLMVKGSYQDTPPRPFVPGLEGAGRIISVGPDVGPETGLAPGQRVAVFSQGTMAEYGIFPARACYPIPDAMSDAVAAGFLIAYGTSHLALLRAGLKPGEALAVLGAAGGVGLTAVEIGAALGARVIAIARGEDRLTAARLAGASDLIDSAACPDLRTALRDLGGVDVVYDPVGDAPGRAAYGALRPGGRFLVIGFAAGKPPELPLNHALVKNLTIIGLYWGAWRDLDPQLFRDSLTQLFALYSEGRIAPRAPVTMPLADLPKALETLEKRRNIGKIVLTMPGDGN